MENVKSAPICPKNRVPAAVFLVAFAGGCYHVSPQPRDTQSFGTTSHGVLRNGQVLPERGAGFVRARPGEATRYGTARLVRAITASAASVAQRYPGTPPLRVGDLSSPQGGQHRRHGSHRTGRDVDVIFYGKNQHGEAVRGRGWLAYDRFGVARETVARAGQRPSDEVFFFDDARNWALVRALLADETLLVQWIFCSRGIKARLLRYAALHESDADILFRASWVLHQPSRGHPHDDHFHIRVGCDPREQMAGCRNRGPIWSWFRSRVEKPPEAQPALTDDSLAAELLRPLQ